MLSRRSAIKALAVGCVAPEVLASCASARGAAVARPAYTGPRLARVRVSPDRVIRNVVGLRPYRRSGFRVAAEAFGDKTLIHNYGHGGGGITLSWGTAQMALELAAATQHRTAAVIGCGVIGLSTARLLQDAGFAVTIYARDLPPATTSNIAGAQWAPVSVADADIRTSAFDDQLVRASRFAYRYFQNLAGPRYAVWWRENYFVHDTRESAESVPLEARLIPDILRMTVLAPGEHPFGARFLQRMLTMHIEPAPYLTQVLADYRLAGGRVVVREFVDRQSLLTLTEPLIVNCTGLGARQLFDDLDLMPARGQLVVLPPQPEVDYLLLRTRPNSSTLYMMPRQDGIILGGTFQRGNWSLDPSPEDADRILRGHAELFAMMSVH